MASFTMDDRCGFHTRVMKNFDKFWQWKLPCPVDPFEDIYRNAFSDKEWVAMRYLLQEKPAALGRGSCFTLLYGEPGDSHRPSITFSHPDGMQLPSFGVDLNQIPERIQAQLRSWIVGVNYFRSMRNELELRCKGVMGNPTGTGQYYQKRKVKDLDPRCNTPAQLYRLWPEVQPFFYPRWKREVVLSSCASRLPKQVGFEVYRDGRTVFATPEQFRAEDDGATEWDQRRFRDMNEILTMLSLAQDIPAVSDYPQFKGGAGS